MPLSRDGGSGQSPRQGNVKSMLCLLGDIPLHVCTKEIHNLKSNHKMIINLTLNGKKYSIEIDGYQYIPRKHTINTKQDSPNFGKEMTTDLAYCTSLSNAVAKLTRNELSSSDDVVSLKEFIVHVQSLNDEIKTQFDTLNL